MDSGGKSKPLPASSCRPLAGRFLPIASAHARALLKLEPASSRSADESNPAAGAKDPGIILFTSRAFRCLRCMPYASLLIQPVRAGGVSRRFFMVVMVFSPLAVVAGRVGHSRVAKDRVVVVGWRDETSGDTTAGYAKRPCG